MPPLGPSRYYDQSPQPPVVEDLCDFNAVQYKHRRVMYGISHIILQVMSGQQAAEPRERLATLKYMLSVPEVRKSPIAVYQHPNLAEEQRMAAWLQQPKYAPGPAVLQTQVVRPYEFEGHTTLSPVTKPEIRLRTRYSQSEDPIEIVGLDRQRAPFTVQHAYITAAGETIALILDAASSARR